MCLLTFVLLCLLTFVFLLLCHILLTFSSSLLRTVLHYSLYCAFFFFYSSMYLFTFFFAFFLIVLCFLFLPVFRVCPLHILILHIFSLCSTFSIPLCILHILLLCRYNNGLCTNETVFQNLTKTIIILTGIDL